MSGRAPTPSQTVGPFFHIMLREPMNALATAHTAGTHIRIEGFVYDGDRAAVSPLARQQGPPAVRAGLPPDGGGAGPRSTIALRGGGKPVFFKLYPTSHASLRFPTRPRNMCPTATPGPWKGSPP